MTGRTLLITGGRGLCGGELVRHFERLPDWTVHTVDRRPLDRHRHIQFDLGNPVSPGELGFPERLDAVIHTAAEVDQQTASYAVIEANVKSTFNTARFAADAGARSFVNFSSSTVYGVPPDPGANGELDRPVPNTNYGLSKLLAEQIVASIVRGMTVTHLRLGYVLGRGVPDRGMIARLVRALQDNQPVRIENPDRTAFQFVDTRDVAAICQRIIEEEVSGTYNLASASVTSLGELFDYLRARFPESASSVDHVERPEKVLRGLFPVDRLHVALNPLELRDFRKSIDYALLDLRRD